MAEQASHEVVPWNADVDLGDAHAGSCDLTRLGTSVTLPDRLVADLTSLG